MAAVKSFSRRIGAILKELAVSREAPSSWFTPHMAAAARAVVDRAPLVDFTVEVRDARVPLSSAFAIMDHVSYSHRRVILLNKADLANRSQTEKWIKYFEEKNCFCYAVNSHNKENIKGLLKFVQARAKELQIDESYAATFMLVGIPNVGKSAVVNAMHQIGRISAEEKGKLKHAVVTSQPGETKDICSYKIASHPNIYVLDTPGILSPGISHFESGAKLALTGSISDSLIGELELAKYFLAIFDIGDGYTHWKNLNVVEHSQSVDREDISTMSGSSRRKKRQYPSDHTQDFVVRDVRRTLFNMISSFKGNLDSESELAGLIEAQILELHEAFRVPRESGEEGCIKVATKLLNLYRTGRLGRYTLDSIPEKLNA